ncbi:MAG: hypothetical protein EBS01_07130 [Verrucomicrobia bacterium]|nr:hypothetical protein [Verrucomicrobiota bacterium]
MFAGGVALQAVKHVDDFLDWIHMKVPSRRQGGALKQFGRADPGEIHVVFEHGPFRRRPYRVRHPRAVAEDNAGIKHTAPSI